MPLIFTTKVSEDQRDSKSKCHGYLIDHESKCLKRSFEQGFGTIPCILGLVWNWNNLFYDNVLPFFGFVSKSKNVFTKNDTITVVH